MTGKKKYIKKAKDAIIQFDSCSALLNALGRFLNCKNFYGAGILPDVPGWLGDAVNLIPKNIRKRFYSWGGWVEAIPSKKIQHLKAEDISQWVTSLYPEKEYGGMMFGAANGAAIHLCAAMGIPWLPQTYLVAARRLLRPDEIHKDIEWGKRVISSFLHDNPDLLTIQMHDPVQDRLMIEKMGYFRIKRLKMGQVFKDFIKKNLSRGYPLFTVECDFNWPMLRLSERHLFQVGGLGALSPDEYLFGSERVTEFLRRVGSPLRKWDTFKPSGHYPEGEWGFSAEALGDVKKFVYDHKIPLVRMIFRHPEAISSFVADLYRWWYEKRGIRSKRLIIENFGLVAPYDVIQTRSIPFWLAFNTEPSYRLIKKYLRRKNAPDEIYLMLMSNGVAEGVGLTAIDEWKKILKKAQKKSDFIGVDKREYPLDLGTYMKYDDELKKKIPERKAPPRRLGMDELWKFIRKSRKKYDVEFKKVSARK